MAGRTSGEGSSHSCSSSFYACAIPISPKHLQNGVPFTCACTFFMPLRQHLAIVLHYTAHAQYNGCDRQSCVHVQRVHACTHMRSQSTGVASVLDALKWRQCNRPCCQCPTYECKMKCDQERKQWASALLWRKCCHFMQKLLLQLKVSELGWLKKRRRRKKKIVVSAGSGQATLKGLRHYKAFSLS